MKDIAAIFKEKSHQYAVFNNEKYAYCCGCCLKCAATSVIIHNHQVKLHKAYTYILGKAKIFIAKDTTRNYTCHSIGHPKFVNKSRRFASHQCIARNLGSSLANCKQHIRCKDPPQLFQQSKHQTHLRRNIQGSRLDANFGHLVNSRFYVAIFHKITFYNQLFSRILSYIKISFNILPFYIYRILIIK